MSRKQRTNYYVMFVNLQNYSRQAVNYLHYFLRDFDPTPDVMLQKMEELHAIEHEADQGKHKMMQVLAKDFVTPIEREDIIAIMRKLDDITDAIEDVLQKIYMYNVSSIRPEALEFLDIIQQQCKIVADVFSEFHDPRHSDTIHDNIIEVNRLEEEGDTLYTRSVRRLFEEENDIRDIVAWNAIFEQLEHCCDTNEEAVNTVEEVIMKNS